MTIDGPFFLVTYGFRICISHLFFSSWLSASVKNEDLLFIAALILGQGHIVQTNTGLNEHRFSLLFSKEVVH